MAAIIEIQNLTKKFGARTAIDGLTLNVSAGEIFGFVGPNGAGKTSTIRIMTTLLQQTGGDVRIAGCSAERDPAGVRQVTGYMPDVFGLYRSMKVWEYLDFFAGCYHIPETARGGLIADLLELVDLSHRREDMVESLSRGMQQRLSLARTLVHDPQVLILDEPASGLDPRARVEIRELLVELAHMGKTIFFSTHILADVAEICTRVGIIEAGKLVALGELEALQQQVMPLRTVEVTLLSGIDRALELLGGMPAVSGAKEVGVQNGRQRLEFEFSGDDPAISQALAALVAAGIPVVQFTSGERDLEAVFMRATRGLVT